MSQSDPWSRILDGVEQELEQDLAVEIAQRTRLTEAQVKAIAPSAADRAKLVELLSIVSDAAKNNRQKANSLRQIEGIAEIAIRLLAKLV